MPPADHNQWASLVGCGSSPTIRQPSLAQHQQHPRCQGRLHQFTFVISMPVCWEARHMLANHVWLLSWTLRSSSSLDSLLHHVGRLADASYRHSSKFLRRTDVLCDRAPRLDFTTFGNLLPSCLLEVLPLELCRLLQLGGMATRKNPGRLEGSRYFATRLW